MNLKSCEKRFLVINSPFFLHVPAFVLDCVHAVQWGGGGGWGGVIFEKFQLVLIFSRKKVHPFCYPLI